MHSQSITHNATRRAFSAAFPCEGYKINDQSRSICFFFFLFSFIFLLFLSSLFLFSSLSSLGPPGPHQGPQDPSKGPGPLTQLWLLYLEWAPASTDCYITYRRGRHRGLIDMRQGSMDNSLKAGHRMIWCVPFIKKKTSIPIFTRMQQKGIMAWRNRRS